MTLYEKIMSMYPSLTEADFTADGNVVLRNDGEGDYIAKWEHPTLPCPTEEELA